jgi:hypothetical protein
MYHIVVFVSHMGCMRTMRLKMLEVFAVGDSRAREVVFSSLMQLGVDISPWFTHTQKTCELWATLKGPE